MRPSWIGWTHWLPEVDEETDWLFSGGPWVFVDDVLMRTMRTSWSGGIGGATK